MSYFKTTSNTVSYNDVSNRKNAFTTDKPVTYNFHEELFPELTDTKDKNPDTKDKNPDTNKENSNNYALAAATPILETVVEKVFIIPDNKTLYTFYKSTGKTIVEYGKKSLSELEKDKQFQLENEPNYIGETILKELSYNWKRYKKEYDGLHGVDAYDNLYYTEPIYPYLDEMLAE
jgi:hypothetical protein